MSDATVQLPADEFDWFVGIDWGTAQHAVDVSDAMGRQVAEQSVEHTSQGLARFVDWLTALAGGRLTRVAVAIEVPRGAVVELLLERGAVVFALNPKQLDRFRDRFSVAGAKDDRLDARVLRSSLRTDRDRFRRLTLDEPVVIRIRELTRAEDVLQHEFLGLTNRLRELVHRIAPEWLTLVPSADEPWFWMLLERAWPPTTASRVRRRSLQELLTTYRIRRLTADDVLTVLRQPALTVAPGTGEAVSTHIQLLLPRVRLVHAQRQTCARALRTALEELAAAEAAPPGPPVDRGSAGSASTEPSVANDPGPARDPGDVAIVRSAPGIGIGVTAA